MRVGIVFHKNPFAPPAGIDLVRLRAIAGGMTKRGIDVEIVSPVQEEGEIPGVAPVKRLAVLGVSGRYDIVKTSYHDSIALLGDYKGPVVSRIVRVVDSRLPERDAPFREKLLQCQALIKARASAVVFNNSENSNRWLELYGDRPPAVLIPTGSPKVLPSPKGNPYAAGPPVMLFLGSLAAPRMVRMLNDAAMRLRGICTIHLVGLNKACMYGGDTDCQLDPLVIDHGELAEEDVWDYILNADVGLALATGPHAFDNDVSKILNYLRGGLPVLSEEPILNNELVKRTGLGATFKLGDLDELVTAALRILENPFAEIREQVMGFMAEEHSWERRVDAYIHLFNRILSDTI